MTKTTEIYGLQGKKKEVSLIKYKDQSLTFMTQWGTFPCDLLPLTHSS